MRTKFGDADTRHQECEQKLKVQNDQHAADIKAITRELNYLKGQNMALLLAQLPKGPLVIAPDGAAVSLPTTKDNRARMRGSGQRRSLAKPGGRFFCCASGRGSDAEPPETLQSFIFARRSIPPP